VRRLQTRWTTSGLRPDGKSQVSVTYDQDGNIASIDTVVISAQHDESKGLEDLRYELEDEVRCRMPIGLPAIGRVLINPGGRFVLGGPAADAGLTGRKIVVDTGSADTRRWREHRRSIVADYVRAFGEPPGRLIGVGVMTDADNTRARALAWYGRITLHPSPIPAVAPASGR
jgi:hypothetical protein